MKTFSHDSISLNFEKCLRQELYRKSKLYVQELRYVPTCHQMSHVVSFKTRLHYQRAECSVGIATRYGLGGPGIETR